MNENKVSEIVLVCCFTIHRNLGPGLYESVYEEILVYELSVKNLKFTRQKVISLKYGDITLESAFRADFIVEKKVIIELKSVESILPLHKKQLLTYLKITDCKLGFIINFNSTLLKDGIIRIVNKL
jgi:GxxExxY protein